MLIPGLFPPVVRPLGIPLLLYPVMVLVILPPMVETSQLLFQAAPSSFAPSLMILSTRTSIFGYFAGLLDLLDPLKVEMLGDIGLFVQHLSKIDGLLQRND